MSAEISSMIVGVEPAAQVQEAGLGEERRDVVVIVVGRERARAGRAAIRRGPRT